MIKWLKRLFSPNPDKLELALKAKEAALLEREKKLEKLGKSSGVFSTHAVRPALDLDQVSDIAFPIKGAHYVDAQGRAMDSCVNVPNEGYRFSTRGGVPDNVIGWFLSQSFVGHQICAIMSQNWLINRACKIPAEDATRNGWKIEGVDDVDALEELDKAWDIMRKCQEFARFNRVFGIRIAIFMVENDDKLYYEKPFNIDSVTPGSYRGISQVDPNWCAAEFNEKDTSDPASPTFYEPTYWRIGGKRYHKSHLVVIRYAEVPDLLKPTYLFGGIPLPQLIWERVYAAERSANEGPQLLLTKRMNIIKTDLDTAMADPDAFAEKNRIVAENRDNYGNMNLGLEDSYEQHETSLGDFDAVCMTEYQLVAGVAEMPATKLIGTTPKGFNATGDYEMGVYRETLATIQEHHCGPLLQRHYMLACKSKAIKGQVTVVWNPLDEPTEQERATTNLAVAQTRQIYQELGAVSQEQTQKVVESDTTLGYNFEEVEDGDEEDNELAAAILAFKPPTPVQQKVAPSNEGPKQVSSTTS